MNILYFDCFSGISGDMALGALLDLGAPLKEIKEFLRMLPLEGYTLEAEASIVQGLSGTRVKIQVENDPDGINEGFPTAPGAEMPHKHAHSHSYDHSHSHDHSHEHDHSHGTHRGFREIRAILESSDIPKEIADRSIQVFRRLAEAEGKIHGMEPEDVSFHEVGSVDAIVDVVSVVSALHLLNIDAIKTSPLPMGRGFVDCAHGRFPLPAPAVLEMTKGVPVYGDPRPGEWVTPTGAAIVTALSDSFGQIPNMNIDRVGYGLGKRDGQGIPNALRALLGTQGQPPEKKNISTDFDEDTVTVLSAAVDDMNPEHMQPLIQALLDAGAIDAYLIPILMKKGRPGHLIQALCAPAKQGEIGGVLLQHSTSIGLRFHEEPRLKAPRHFVKIDTEFGQVSIKIAQSGGLWTSLKPEFEDCHRLSVEKNVPIQVVERAAIAAAYGLELERTSPHKKEI